VGRLLRRRAVGAAGFRRRARGLVGGVGVANGSVISWRRYPCNFEHYHDGSVVDVVVVVPLIGLLTGDAAAWAGTNTVSTIGLIHLEGMRMVTVRPPTANISRARRRVVLLSVIETLPFARSPVHKIRCFRPTSERRPSHSDGSNYTAATFRGAWREIRLCIGTSPGRVIRPAQTAAR
jgi:hypothetical protein